MNRNIIFIPLLFIGSISLVLSTDALHLDAIAYNNAKSEYMQKHDLPDQFYSYMEHQKINNFTSYLEMREIYDTWPAINTLYLFISIIAIMAAIFIKVM